MNRMLPILAACAILAAGPDSDAAFFDRARLPYDQQQHAVYLTLATAAPEHRDQLEQVLRFVVPSLSSKPYLGDQLPIRVSGTNLLRLDLAGLGWEKTYQQAIAHYPWRPDVARGYVPLVVRGDWLAAALTDPIETGDAHYRLLYGTPPKNAKEFQATWKANADPLLSFGRIEGKSGVSVQNTRVLENLPSANRAYFWQTFDSRVIAGQTDPLENLTARPPKHDASELIAGIPKHLGGKSGTLQAYFLADAKGNRQEKAPADIVVDDTQTRGVEIRNTISCIGCHTDAIRHPTLDSYREYILSGARIYTKDKATQTEIDRYLDSPIAKEIERNNQDYAAGLALCNSLTPAENAAAFRAVVHRYDADVTPEQAARELYAEPETWRLALGDYSRTYQLTGRLAVMAQGQPISRQQWQSNFHLAQKVLAAWHATSHSH
jgi:hypothetical protein